MDEIKEIMLQLYKSNKLKELKDFLLMNMESKEGADLVIEIFKNE